MEIKTIVLGVDQDTPFHTPTYGFVFTPKPVKQVELPPPAIPVSVQKALDKKAEKKKPEVKKAEVKKDVKREGKRSSSSGRKVR